MFPTRRSFLGAYGFLHGDELLGTYLQNLAVHTVHIQIAIFIVLFCILSFVFSLSIADMLMAMKMLIKDDV